MPQLSRPRFPLIVVVVLVSCVLQPPSSLAQISKIDDVGKRIAEKLESLKPHPAIVAIADFQSPDSGLAPQAHYLALCLSSSLAGHGKNFLSVTDHNEFDKQIAILKGSLTSAWSPEDFAQLSAKIDGDFLVLGTAEKENADFVLTLRAVRVRDGTLIDSETAKVHSSEFLESLSIPLKAPAGKSLNQAGVNGVGMPSCPRCPDPEYNDLARRARVSGTVVLFVLVSADGRAEQIQPIKLLGAGLDEQAYNTVKKTWKFDPARDPNGNPIAVALPVEVTFRVGSN